MASSYDFIVVGGGTAGLVVATRLSEIPDLSILVIEAGDDHSNDSLVRTPGLWPSLLGTEADWGFVTEEQVGTLKLYMTCSWEVTSSFHDVANTPHRLGLVGDRPA